MKTISLLIIAVFLFSACGKTKKASEIGFSEDKDTNTDSTDQVTPYLDKFATEKINLTQTQNINQQFKVAYKTFNPDGVGYAEFKARSAKLIDLAGTNPADNGKKLFLVEISVRGSKDNRGMPSTFNQIGDTPSPQFVIIDKANSRTYVEETFFSDSYTVAKKLFELSKLTLDMEQWVDTAIVFQIDKNLEPDLAFRFLNKDGKLEFYDIR